MVLVEQPHGIAHPIVTLVVERNCGQLRLPPIARRHSWSANADLELVFHGRELHETPSGRQANDAAAPHGRRCEGDRWSGLLAPRPDSIGVLLPRSRSDAASRASQVCCASEAPAKKLARKR